MSYWDIHDFLAEEEIMSIKFREDAEGMEFLAPYKGFVQSVPEEEPIQLPIWRGTNLHVYCQENNLITIQIPKNYANESFFSFLQSFTKQTCPNNSKMDVINLKRKSPYYYQAANRISVLFEGNDSFASVDKIAKCFSQRADWITSKAMSTNEMAELALHKKKFTNFEYVIYRTASEQVTQYNDWKQPRRKIDIIKGNRKH